MTSAYKKGLASEHACISKLILSNHVPCIPASGGESYDIAVINDDKIVKIQVKSTRSKDYNKYECIICKGRSSKSVYDENEIDYFCVHIVPEDMWFIIPHSATKGRKKIRIDPYCPEHEFWQYKEDWTLGVNDPVVIEATDKRQGKRPTREKPIWSVQ